MSRSFNSTDEGSGDVDKITWLQLHAKEGGNKSYQSSPMTVNGHELLESVSTHVA